MITYGDNRVHLVRIDGEIYGAIRSAIRDDSRRRHGFWTSRKTVELAWNPPELSHIEIPEVSGTTIREVRSFDVEKMTDFILDSHQPYWRFWKEYKEDMRWVRVEYGEDDDAPDPEELQVEMRVRVREKLEKFNAESDQVFFVALEDGEIIAACDALDSSNGDTFEWGMLAVYDYGIKNLGPPRGSYPPKQNAEQSLPHGNHQHTPEGIEKEKRPNQLQEPDQDDQEKLRSTADPDVRRRTAKADIPGPTRAHGK